VIRIIAIKNKDMERVLRKKSLLVTCFSIIMLFTGCGTYADIRQQKESALDPAQKDSFSIVVIPDSQDYFGEGTKLEPESQDEITNPVLESQTNWIVENIDNQRIIFVSHVGDIVDKNIHNQWVKARQYMNIIHGKIPYGISVGNHDMTPIGNSSLFQQYFSASRFAEYEWYGGCYNVNDFNSDISGNNANSYQLFSVEDIDFLILHLECNAPDAVLQWANEILIKHKERFAIISTHMFLGPLEKPEKPEDYYSATKGVMKWIKRHGINGNTAEEMWIKCFSKHKNIKLIFCGDQSRTNTMHLELNGNEGNRVHALLSDYMLESGPLRIYRFLPKSNKIKIITYNPSQDIIVHKTKIIQENEKHNFEITIDFTPFMKNTSKKL